jgi:hypothetical protein
MALGSCRLTEAARSRLPQEPGGGRRSPVPSASGVTQALPGSEASSLRAAFLVTLEDLGRTPLCPAAGTVAVTGGMVLGRGWRWRSLITSTCLSFFFF